MSSKSRWQTLRLPTIVVAALLAFASAASAKWWPFSKPHQASLSSPQCFGYYPTCWGRWPAECPHCLPCQSFPASLPLETTPPPPQPSGTPPEVLPPAATVKPADKTSRGPSVPTRRSGS